jgi:hypothetical protein
MLRPFQFVYQGDCCSTSSSSEKRLRSLTANRSACELHCSEDDRCHFVSRRDQLCVLCASCELRAHSGHFLSWSRAPLPEPVEQLAEHLQGNYSMQLYGATGLVDVKSLRIIWLSLLTPTALHLIRQLGALCKYSSGYPWRPFLVALDLFANPQNAMWVSWERETYRGFPVANNSWVEVTHCSQSRNLRRGYAWQFGPMWLYPAPGSGVSINVGRTVVMSHADAARLLRRVYPTTLECACRPGCAFGLLPGSAAPVRNGSSCIRSYRAQWPADQSLVHQDPGSIAVAPHLAKLATPYSRCWTRDDVLAELDTIQIYDHVEYFSRERRHEIVRLRHDGECSWLAPSTPNLMCGRYPQLSPCPQNSSALKRVNTCTSSKAPLPARLSHALNFTTTRCQMTSSFATPQAQPQRQP